MSEITKLYENAGVEPKCTDECKLADEYWSDEEYLECHWLFVDVNKKDNKDEHVCGKREDSRGYREQSERNNELH